MGFGHRIYRAEDPRSRILKRTAKELDAPYVESRKSSRKLRSRRSRSGTQSAR